MKSYKRILSIFLVVLMALSVVNAGSVLNTAHALEEESAPHFSSEYAKPGEKLKVIFESEAEVSFQWYVDGKKISQKTDSYVPKESDLEKFISVEISEGGTLVSTLSIFCSLLPVVYIDTENGEKVTSKETYINSTVRIQGNDAYNSETTTLYNGESEIKGHGNSTWAHFDKKAYKLKLDKKTDLFGMGKSKHWLLIANYIDDSLMRNALSVECAKIFGGEYLDCVWVDVVFNGECVGNYQLYEQSRIESTRVDIFNWESAAEDIAKAVKKAEKLTDEDQDAMKTLLTEDLNWMTTGQFVYNEKTYTVSDYYELPESTNGGYLFELDNLFDELSEFKTKRNAPVMIKNPEYLYTNDAVMSQVKGIVQNFEDSIYSEDKCITVGDEKLSYVDYCDFDSIVSYFLSSEILTSEAGIRSTYFYKDIDEKIKFGPIWDFDFSSDSVNPFGPTYAKKWRAFDGYWFNAIAKDPYFAVKCRELFNKKYDELLSLYKENGLVDLWYEYLYLSAMNNDSIWPYSRGYEEDVSVLKQWLNEKVDWMNGELASDASAVSSFGGVTSGKLSLELTDVKFSSDGYFIKENAQSTVNLKIKSEVANQANYYINGKFTGTVALENGVANVTVPVELLDEEIDSKNVITVRLVEENGSLSSMQYVTVTVSSTSLSMSDITFIDGDTVKKETYINGTEIVLGKSVQNSSTTIVSGWNDGFNTYVEGSKYIVNGSVRLIAVLEKCADGTTVHQFVLGDDCYICQRCEKTKADDNEYISVANCTYTQSSRYNNTYTGKELAPTITVKYDGKILTEGVDYTITYRNNINIGYATYVVRGIKSAGYDGETSLSYRIVPRNISQTKAVVSKCVYDGKEKIPELTLSYNGITLVEGKDYTLAYSDNIQVGKGKAEVTGIGNFSGTKSVGFDIVYPVKPVGELSVKKVSSNETRLTWKINTDCDYYVVYRKATDEASYSKLAEIYNTKVTAFIDSSVTTGMKYSYKVVCEKTVNGLLFKSEDNKAVSVTITPDKPVLSVSAVNYNTLKLSWKAVKGAGSYEIWRSASKLGTYKKLATVSTTSYSDTTVKTGTSYYYKLRACGKDNPTVYSSYSNVVSGKTTLAKPSNVKVSLSKTSVKLSFSKVSGASDYEIYRSTSKAGSYKKLATTKSLSYTDSSVKIGKTYYYKVRAYITVSGSKVYSTYSSVVSKKVSLGAPSGVKAEQVMSSINVTFSKVSGAGGYEVYRSTSKSGSYIKFATVKGNSCSDSTVKTGKTYYYKVRAYATVDGKKVYSPWSTIVSCKAK